MSLFLLVLNEDSASSMDLYGVFSGFRGSTVFTFRVLFSNICTTWSSVNFISALLSGLAASLRLASIEFQRFCSDMAMCLTHSSTLQRSGADLNFSCASLSPLTASKTPFSVSVNILIAFSLSFSVSELFMLVKEKTSIGKNNKTSFFIYSILIKMIEEKQNDLCGMWKRGVTKIS